MLVGAAVLIAAPCGCRTQPNSPYSGSIPSIREKTLLTRSTSTTRPFAAGSPFTCQQAATTAMAQYMPARSSLMETPQRGGGYSVWPGLAVRWRKPPIASPIAPKAGLSR